MGRRDKLRAAAAAVATAVLMWLLLYAQTPYVVYEPGVAIPLDGMVQAGAAAGEPSAGRFMMTTVTVSPANYWHAIETVWNSNMDLYEKKTVMGSDSEEEYMSRMAVIMRGSEDDAIEAAYRYAGIEYAVVPQQVAVAAPLPGSSLQEGMCLSVSKAAQP
ncbi:hypothetical protein [Paenibacillus protaetiae]|nr:hypothetical protein [Paenibacillus protaetiae]